MNRTLLLAVGLVVAGSASAMAADLPMPAQQPSYYKAPPPPPPSLSGCYVDAGGGYGVANLDHHAETVGLVALDATTTSGGRGWLGRFGGGCDYELTRIFSSNLIVGVLGDYDVMSISGNVSDPAFPVIGNANESAAWYAGARVGLAMTPSLLGFVDGGYTGTRGDQVNFVGTAFFLPAHTYSGWFLGGGTETSLAGWVPGLPNGLFLRTEYRFATYQSADQDIFVTGGGAVGATHATPYTQTVTTSLVWKFNWLGR